MRVEFNDLNKYIHRVSINVLGSEHGIWSMMVFLVIHSWECLWIAQQAVSGPVAHLRAVALPSMREADALENRGRCRLGSLDTIEPAPANMEKCGPIVMGKKRNGMNG